MSSRLLIVSIGLLTALAAGNALAQTDWASAYAETQCNGSQVEITVTLDVFGEVPPEIVGWVVDRHVLGACLPDVQVGDVRSLPVGEQQYTVFDEPTVPDRVTLYYVSAVDALGQRTPISWTQRTMYAQAACVGGPVARGTVVELFPGTYHLEVCEGQCWWPLSQFDNQYPPEIPDLVGEVIDLYGEIYSGMEGPYVVATGWDYAPDGCAQAVSADAVTWGAVKSLYR